MEKPIFIFAQARSGSTLLQRLLNSLEDVLIYGEHLGILKSVADSYTGFLNNSKRPEFCSESADPARFHAEARKQLRDPLYFAAITNGLSRVHIRENYRRFVKGLLHPIYEPEVQQWGFKEIRYGCGDFVFEMLLDLFPAAAFVFLVRNPVDMLESIEATGWWETKLDENLQTWFVQATHFLRYHRGHPNNTFFVKYEDLTNPASMTAPKLFQALNHKFGPTQEHILRKAGKIGAAGEKLPFSDEVRGKILAVCNRPEISGLYPQPG